MEPRERRLLMAFGALCAAMVVMLVPLGVSSLLDEKTQRNDQLEEAISRLRREADDILDSQSEQEALIARYDKPAPALAVFLDKAASQSNLAISEISDRSPVEHGKKYEERSSAFSLKKVGLADLVRFMEKVSGSSHPISITKLNIRKRRVEPDSYDAQMVVSAYHRIAPSKKPSGDEGKNQ